MAQQAVDWNGIQERFAQEAQAQPQQQAQQIDDSTPIGRALSRVTQQDPTRLNQLAGFLTQGANSQYASQEAMLGQARDQQVTELERTYAQAVEEGNISVRQAEKELQEQKDAINLQAYNDSERTQVMATDRGIGNSQQMMGMIASDNARQSSLINKAMTERDQRVANVKDRISTLLTNKNLDITNANSNFNYGLANQRGQIGSALSQQMFGMGYDDYNQRQDRMFQIGQLGLGDELQRGQMALSQQYNMDNMAKQNEYQLGQMGVQHEFDMSKMSQQQINIMEQMVAQHGMTLEQMDAGQLNDLAKMAVQYENNMGLQNDQQTFQSSENVLERSFKLDQFKAEQDAVKDNYDLEVARELASFTDTNSDAYKLRSAQIDSSYQAVQLESQAKLMADVMGKSFADHIGSPPVHPGKSANKAKIDAYNKQVETYNAKTNAYMSDPTNMQTFITNVENADYNKKTDTRPATQNNWLDTLLRGASNPPGGAPGISNGGDWFNPTP